MDPSLEKPLLPELRQVCNRLGEAVAEIFIDPSSSKEKVDNIRAELDELRLRMRELAAADS